MNVTSADQIGKKNIATKKNQAHPHQRLLPWTAGAWWPENCCTDSIWDDLFFRLPLGITGRCRRVYCHCAGHQGWCGSIGGGSSRRTHLQMALFTPCKPSRNLELCFASKRAYKPSDYDSGPWPTFLVTHASVNPLGDRFQVGVILFRTRTFRRAGL